MTRARLALLALAATLITAIPAAADTLVVADPTAQNVTAYGATSAWSRKADDGTYRLVVKVGSGAPADARVKSLSVPFDPDLGPTSDGQRMIVYGRCARGSATKTCDVYAYDVSTRKEKKVAAVSSKAASEVAPSFFKGAIAFGRRGANQGLYLARAGQGAKRVNIASPVKETDLSASRVVAKIDYGQRNMIVLSRFASGLGDVVSQSFLSRTGAGERLFSPVLTRYAAYWLRVAANGRYTLVQRISTRSRTDPGETAVRPFPSRVTSLAVDDVPTLFSDPGGISSISPKLSFEPPPLP